MFTVSQAASLLVHLVEEPLDRLAACATVCDDRSGHTACGDFAEDALDHQPINTENETSAHFASQILDTTMTKRSRDAKPDESESTPSEMTRSVISLLIVLHLVCVFWVVTANVLGSPIQVRVATILRPYTRIGNFETTFAEFQLTYGDVLDANHRIEILPEGSDAENMDDWVALPDVGIRGTARYQRLHRLAETLAAFNEADEITSRIVLAAASDFNQRHSVRAAQVRCRRHRGQELKHAWNEQESDPNNEGYFEVVYGADIKYDGSSMWSNKHVGGREAAQPGMDESKGVGKVSD